MNNQQQQKPKEELHEIMCEVFSMIEEMNIQEGKYLEFAEMFKKMNINVNRLAEMKQVIIQNVYYQRYVKNTTTIKRKRLTEAQKAVSSHYTLCSCGCYIQNTEHLNHINNTLKHRTGLRNKKYSAKNGRDDGLIDFEINREVILQGFCINHYSAVNAIRVDADNSLV